MPTETGDMQRFVDRLFRDTQRVSRLDAMLLAETLDLPDTVLAIVSLLPPGRYGRQRLCDQLNSAITAHGYGSALGTVE